MFSSLFFGCQLLTRLTNPKNNLWGWRAYRLRNKINHGQSLCTKGALNNSFDPFTLRGYGHVSAITAYQKIILPTCDQPSVRLAKDASLYAIICKSPGLLKFGMWIWNFSFFAFFTVRLICFMHSTFSCFHMELNVLTSKLRSGLVWVARQFSLPISCLASMISEISYLPGFWRGMCPSFFTYSSCPILMFSFDFLISSPMYWN